MRGRNIATVTLMSLSILLLLILQGLWLQNSYEKALYDLRRDTNYVFRNTIYSLRDSMFLKNIKPVESDTLPPGKIETVRIYNKQDADSMKITMESSTIQIFVNNDSHSDNDSIIKALRPMAQHFNMANREGKSFVVRLSPDTIKIDTLNTVFTQALADASLPVKFSITRDLLPPEKMGGLHTRMDSSPDQKKMITIKLLSDTLLLETVRLNPLSRYSASIFNFKNYILKSIAPQILFSFLLTVITLIAFIVLFKSLRSQQRLMELKNDFINNMTHELKTPVATVSVALEALKNFHALNDAERTTEYLDIAQHELNRLTLMTDKILKSSSFESNGVIIQKETVDPERMVNEILYSMKIVFEKHQAQVSFTKEGADFLIEGSQAHLTNVLYNLIDNALKYSREKTYLSITLKDLGANITLAVQDNGMGIPSEYKKKIFEKFFRVPSGDIHNIKGYGLGLSYVAGVVQEHNGTIEVTSEPGKGSTFTLHLPKKSS